MISLIRTNVRQLKLKKVRRYCEDKYPICVHNPPPKSEGQTSLVLDLFKGSECVLLSTLSCHSIFLFFRIFFFKMSTFLPPIKFCFLFVVLFYGSLNLISDALYSVFAPGVIAVGLLSISIYFLRVPPPDDAIVWEIIGDDPALIADDDVKKKNNLVRSMGHRGCGLDAPENTLESFKYVSEVMFTIKG